MAAIMRVVVTTLDFRSLHTFIRLHVAFDLNEHADFEIGKAVDSIDERGLIVHRHSDVSVVLRFEHKA